MTNQVIPAEAVEAAARVLFDSSPVSRGAKPWSEQMTARIKDQFHADARAALEAAAPHMQAPGIRRPMEKGALFEELRRLNPSGALLKDIEALEQQD